MKIFKSTLILITIVALPALAQLVVKNSNGDQLMIVNSDGQVGIGVTSPAAGTKLEIAGMTKTDDLRVGTSAAGQALVATDATGTATWGTIGSVGVTDNSLTATDLQVNVVSSVEGVINDGGNIDLVPTGNITITPNNSTNQITIGSEPATFTHSLAHSQDIFYTGTPHTIGTAYTVQESGTYLIILTVDAQNLMHNGAATKTYANNALVSFWLEKGSTRIGTGECTLQSYAQGWPNHPTDGQYALWANRATVSQTYIATLSQSDQINLRGGLANENTGAHIFHTHTRITGIRLY
ncbi:hypothetical protein GF406_08685 [candidate division KSB1 bacterium]|nr:hypothetical protein [candidate division KSB1 bacterium]